MLSPVFPNIDKADKFLFFCLSCLRNHADKYKFGVVQQFVGHGVGRVFHAEPTVLHFSEYSNLCKHSPY